MALNPAFEIRTATVEEFEIAAEWATTEGWNPGLDDVCAFHQSDPNGFLVGWIHDVPVTCISVVRYGRTVGFVGFYIVRKEYRGCGYGLATWKHGMAHLKGCVIGLDAVLTQQERYKLSGFKCSGRNIRFSGVPSRQCSSFGALRIRDVTPADKDTLFSFDRHCFGAERGLFIQEWVYPKSTDKRSTSIAYIDSTFVGYITIRRCNSGYKVGPLFSTSTHAARCLIISACDHIHSGSTITLDVPTANAAALTLAHQIGLSPVSETTRMYAGGAHPELPFDKIFGITSLELG